MPFCNTAGVGQAFLPIPAAVPTVFILVIRDRDDDTDPVTTRYTAVFLLNGCATPCAVSAETAQQLICAGCPFIDRDLDTDILRGV